MIRIVFDLSIPSRYREQFSTHVTQVIKLMTGDDGIDQSRLTVLDLSRVVKPPMWSFPTSIAQRGALVMTITHFH